MSGEELTAAILTTLDDGRWSKARGLADDPLLKDVDREAVYEAVHSLSKLGLIEKGGSGPSNAKYRLTKSGALLKRSYKSG